MIQTPFLDKKYKIVFQNFLYIEYYKKRFFLWLTKELVKSAAFYIEKGIVEGIPVGLYRAIAGLVINYRQSFYHKFDYINSFTLVIVFILLV